MSVNFVSPEEVYYFVESIRPFELSDIGSEKWLYAHEMIVKLSQQASLEAAEHREEMVKEMLILHDKLKILIHEAYCVNLWKTKVLPYLLEVNPNPQATFLIYTVLYHEGSLMSLLDIALYHSNGCEALQDSAVDLVDYCAEGLSQLIGLVCMGHHENDSKQDVDESILTEMERQKRDFIYLIGLRCISIACYLADNADALPLSAQKRMVTTHDLPWLIVDILNFRPWEKKTKKGIEKFINDKWEVVQGEVLLKLVKHEAQAWLCLVQLLFNNNLMQSYILTEQRRAVLGKCLGMLNDCLLDQLPPLIQLKQYLCQLSMSGNTPSNAANKASLLLEEMPKIKENLIQEAEKAGGFSAIATAQEMIFLYADKNVVQAMAQRLNEAYNFDLVAELVEKAREAYPIAYGGNSIRTCGKCNRNADKKCSKCNRVFYCSKQCQLDDWPKHKNECLKP